MPVIDQEFRQNIVKVVSAVEIEIYCHWRRKIHVHSGHLTAV